MFMKQIAVATLCLGMATSAFAQQGNADNGSKTVPQNRSTTQDGKVVTPDAVDPSTTQGITNNSMDGSTNPDCITRNSGGAGDGVDGTAPTNNDLANNTKAC